MTTYFHLAPLKLEIGSIILPGNWGRIVRLCGTGHARWNNELVLENRRVALDPALPSRLDCCFVCPSEKIARDYRSLQAVKSAPGGWQVLYEVEKVNTEAREHRTDYNLVEPLPALGLSIDQVAERYWEGKMRISIQGHPTVVCEEVLMVSPLRVLGCLD